MLDEDLYIIVVDFNHDSALTLIVFDLADLSIFPTRGNSTLVRITTNYPELVRLKLLAPIPTTDYYLLLLKPEVYSWTAFQPFMQSKQTKYDQVIFLGRIFFVFENRHSMKVKSFLLDL